MIELLATLGIVLLSLVVAAGLARLTLVGLLRAAFHRVRALIRRVTTRRRTQRPELDRRESEGRRK